MIIVLVATVLFVQLRLVTTTYDGLLGSEVHSSLLRGFNPDDLATYTKQFRDESATVDRLGNDLLRTTAARSGLATSAP